MNTALLQNGDVTLRLLILAVPVTIAFLFSIIYLFISARKAAIDSQSTSLFLAVCATSFFYMVIEIMLMLFTENFSITAILKHSVGFFVLLSLLNAVSCVIKGIIGGKRLPYLVGENKEQATARSLIYLSIAELPSLASLVLYMLTFFTE